MSIFSRRGKGPGRDPEKGAFGGHDPMQDMPYRHMPLRPTEAEQTMLNDELMSAVAMCDIRRVCASLARGADAKAWDEGQMTPLMLAAMYNRADIGEALISAGADPLAKIRVGMYAGFDAAVFARMNGSEDFRKIIEARCGSGWRNGK